MAGNFKENTGNFRAAKAAVDEPVKNWIKEQRTRTSVGGGAEIISRYDDKGRIRTKVRLEKGFGGTSSYGAIGKGLAASRRMGAFVESVYDKYAIFKPSDEETADTGFDSKVETLFSQASRDARRKSGRFRDVRLNADKEVKQLGKEIKAARKQDEERLHDTYFNKPNTVFSSDEAKYSKFVDFKFDENSIDKHGIFAVPPDGRMRPDELKKNDQVHFADDTPATSAGTNSMAEANAKAAQKRTMDKGTLEQKKSERKAAKKQENKQARRAAAAAAVSNMLETKKNLTDELMGNGQVTGNLLADGNSGLTRSLVNIMMNAAKKLGASILRGTGRMLMRLLSFFWGIISPFVLPVFMFVFLFGILITAVFTFLGNLLGAESEGGSGVAEYELDAGSGTYTGTPYSDEEIQSIINELYSLYDDFTPAQESVIGRALSAVGCAYSEASHWDHEDNIYDCSELAYLSYLSVGIDISNGGLYTAAEECRAMESAGCALVGGIPSKPGDLIFYGGAGNGRYKGVYHVSIYLGDFGGVGRMVEAYGGDRGVIVSNVRVDNVVSICRVLS